jgi:transposase
MLPTYGWSLQGKKVQARKNTMRSKHHSVLSAVSSSGQFEYIIVDSGNSEEFCKFLEEVVFVKFKDKTHFLMDNARTHHSKVTKKVFEKHSRNQIFTVPYTPELNPIENCFSVIKSRVRYDCPRTFEQLETALKESVPLLTAEKCTNMFRKSFGLTDFKIIR